jgi:HK97 gp10 family phage protein
MDEGINIDVQTTDLKAVFDNLSTKQRETIERKALRAGAAIEQAAITERAPEKVGKGGVLPDGALRTDIGTKMSRDDEGNLIAIVGPGKYTRRIADFVEFGHRIVTGGYLRQLENGKTRGPGTENGTVEPHSFIRPAFEASQEEVSAAICNTLVEEIEKTASGKGTT